VTGDQRKRSDGLETIALISKFARKEIDKVGPVKFNLDRVLEKSGVSRSSVYHHFGSRDGLIAAVETQRSVEEQQGEMELMREFILAAKSSQQIFDAIEFALTVAGDTQGAQRRSRRISSLTASQTNPALALALHNAQLEGSQHLADTLEAARANGLIDPIAPLLGISYMIQSLFVGRILVDISEDKDIDAQWVSATMSTLRHLLNPQ
jgi:AcrR family transcriptional regulator